MILRPPRSHDPCGFACHTVLNSIAGMPKPVVVSVDVAPPIDTVFSFLDVMANHEAFNDHLMKNWRLSGPPTGVGSKVRVTTKALGVTDIIDIEVTDASPPTRIVERNTARKAGRVGQGTYTLSPAATGGTHIEFEYRWLVAPLIDRLTAPLARAVIRRATATAMTRLKALLEQPAQA